MLKVIIIYLIIILISIIVGLNIKLNNSISVLRRETNINNISFEKCKDGICPIPEEQENNNN